MGSNFLSEITSKLKAHSGSVNISIYLLASLALVSTTTSLYSYKSSNLALIKELRETRELAPGFPIPPLELKNTSNRSSTMDFSECKHDFRLLFIMSPFCKYCRVSTAAWKNLAMNNPSCSAALDITGYGLADQRNDQELALYSFTPYFYMTSVSQLYQLNIKTVPQTIVTDSNFKVIHVWTGLLGPASSNEVERLLQQRSANSSIE